MSRPPRGRAASARGSAVADRLELVVRTLDRDWRRALPGAPRIARRAAVGALVAASAAKCRLLAEAPGAADWELGILFADDAMARRLNREYRRMDKPTNVLSFPGVLPVPAGAAGVPLALGDVILARETIVAEARAQAKTVADHVSHLVVHGVFHLLGYDHEAAGAAAEMEGLETEALAALGIANPYARDRGRRLTRRI